MILGDKAGQITNLLPQHFITSQEVENIQQNTYTYLHLIEQSATVFVSICEHDLKLIRHVCLITPVIKANIAK